MSTYNGDSFVDFRNINLKGGASGTGLVRWAPASSFGTNGALWSSNPFGTTDYGLYLNSSGQLVFSSAGTATIIGAPGATSIPIWNAIWAQSQTLQLAGVATFTIDNNTGNNAVLTLTNSGAGSGIILQITNAGTGSDISGTSATWSFSKLGAQTALSSVYAGAAYGTAAVTLTNGDLVISSGRLLATATSNASSSFVFTNNTATTATPFAIAGSGAYTGTTTGSFMTITPSGLTTGTGVYIPTVALSTGKALQLNYAGTTSHTTGIQFQILNSSTAMQASARIFSVSHTGISTASGAGILGEFTSAVADATVILKVTASSTLTGNVLWLAMASVVTGIGLNIPNVDSITTGFGVSVIGSTTALTGAGRLFIVSHTGATSSTGTVAEFKTAATDGTVLLKLTSAASISGVNLSIVGTTGMTTGSLIRATSSTAAAVATNGIYSFLLTGAFTSGASTVGAFHVAGAATVSGTIMSILGGAQTTGIALNITDPSTGMTSGSQLRVISATTGAVATNGIVSFQLSGAYTSTAATLGAVHVSATATVTGTAFSVLAGSMTTGVGAYISDGAGTGLTSGSLLRIATATTGAVATNGVVSLIASAAYTSTSFVGLLTLVANSTTAGTVASVFGNALTTGNALYVSGTGAFTGTGFATVNATGTTTGNIVRINAVAATLTTGRYLSLYDGTSEVFGVGTNGHLISVGTTAAPTATITVAQGITAATVTAGATDTCGVITTTGTQNNTADSTLTLTFGKTYTTAPKAVIISAANAAAALAGAGEAYVSSISATAVVIGIAKSATTAATPSYNYVVIA